MHWKIQNIKNVIYEITIVASEGSKYQEHHKQNKVLCIGIVKISRIAHTKESLLHWNDQIIDNIIHERSFFALERTSYQEYPLFNFYSKLMKMLTGATILPQYIFLIQFLFKIDETPLWRPPPPPPLLITYASLIQN